mmetsp:Transcript_39287/g.92906  ORF Transcript_39287/g.92906 Transcript_39287/m.92906 type:complete len:216 (-) Transcript_39287:94-741(-)
MVDHQLVFIVKLVSQMEQKPVLKPPSRTSKTRSSLQGRIVSLLMLSEIEETARFVQVPHRLSLGLDNELVQKLTRFLVVAEVKCGICHPHHQRFRILSSHGSLRISFELEQAQRTRPVTLRKEFFECGFLLLGAVFQRIRLCDGCGCAPWKHHLRLFFLTVLLFTVFSCAATLSRRQDFQMQRRSSNRKRAQLRKQEMLNAAGACAEPLRAASDD